MPADPYAPSDGDRVMLASGSRRGTILRCFNRVQRTFYFRLRWDDDVQNWSWPDRYHLMAESAGRFTLRCRECEIAFLSDQLGESLCPNCARRAEAPREDAPSHGYGGRGWIRSQRLRERS